MSLGFPIESYLYSKKTKNFEFKIGGSVNYPILSNFSALGTCSIKWNMFLLKFNVFTQQKEKLNFNSFQAIALAKVGLYFKRFFSINAKINTQKQFSIISTLKFHDVFHIFLGYGKDLYEPSPNYIHAGFSCDIL